jgi:hypothetical protein
VGICWVLGSGISGCFEVDCQVVIAMFNVARRVGAGRFRDVWVRVISSLAGRRTVH